MTVDPQKKMKWGASLLDALKRLPKDEFENCIITLVDCYFEFSKPGTPVESEELEAEANRFRNNGSDNDANFKLQLLVTMLMRSPYYYLECFKSISCHKAKINDEWKALCKLINDCYEDLVNGKSIAIEIPSRDQAGSWAANGNDWGRVQLEDDTINIVNRIEDNNDISVFVAIDNDGKAIDIFTESDLPRLTSTQKVKDCIVSKRELVRFKAAEHMKDVYKRLFDKTVNPPIRQVIIDDINGKCLGVVTKREANRWYRGFDPQ
jgi:hypothetical protein